MDIKSLNLLNTRVVTYWAVGLCGFRNSLLVEDMNPRLGIGIVIGFLSIRNGSCASELI